MSENNTTVTSNNSYSQALFELASENYVLLEVEEQAIAILKLIKDSSEFSDLIKNPTTKNNELIKVMEAIADQNNFNGLLKRCISFLIQKRRFFYVEKILKDFIDTCSKKRGEVKAEIISAKKLSDKEIDSIKNELTKNFTSKIKLNYKHDPSLIAGLILKVESTMIDTSIKSKLKQLETKMVEA